MTALIVTIHVIVCLILILVILLQAGRGQGLTGPSFGSGNVQSLFGTGAADFLTKATTVAAICFILTSITLDYIEARKNRSLLEFGKQTSTVDIDSIKKALERVKQEEKAAENALPSAETVEAAAADTVAKTTSAAEQSAAKLEGAADSVAAEIDAAEKSLEPALDEASQAASDTAEAVKDTVEAAPQT